MSAAGAEWGKAAFGAILTEQRGKDSWPITGATFILLHKVAAKPQQSAEVMKQMIKNSQFSKTRSHAS